MTLYHKIQSLYKRDDQGKFLPEFTCPEFEYLRALEWDWSEKVDGTNIRVELGYYGQEGLQCRIGGRTDRAQIPADLYTRLDELFPLEKILEAFEGPVTLYGEGIGPKIQKGGGNLRSSPDFVLFDVKVGSWWLKRQDIVQIADTFGVQPAPNVGVGTLEEAEVFVSNGFLSVVADTPGTQAEGLVLRPMVDLLTRGGDRIITKLKTKDYRV